MLTLKHVNKIVDLVGEHSDTHFCMSYYVPLFSKIVDSSLWSEPDFVVKIFITMLVKKDRDNVCRGSAYNIARWAHKTEEEVLKALEILANPDTKRLEPQLFDGRRIEKVWDGWLILNGEFYQQIMKEANRKRYLTEKQREHRQKAAGKPAVDTEAGEGNPKPEPERKRFEPPTLEMVKLAAAKIGLSDLEAEKFFHYYTANGWRTGKNQLKSWMSALTGWKLRSDEYGSNSRPGGQSPQSVDRNIGNANEGKAHLYRGLGSVSVPEHP